MEGNIAFAWNQERNSGSNNFQSTGNSAQALNFHVKWNVKTRHFASNLQDILYIDIRILMILECQWSR